MAPKSNQGLGHVPPLRIGVVFADPLKACYSWSIASCERCKGSDGSQQYSRPSFQIESSSICDLASCRPLKQFPSTVYPVGCDTVKRQGGQEGKDRRSSTPVIGKSPGVGCGICARK